MAEILLFHHALGLTDGLQSFAERLRANHHTVHCPDAYSGRVFTDLDEGVSYAQGIGHDAMEEVANRAHRQNRDARVVMGFSLGAAMAQQLAQHKRHINACLLMGGALPPEALGGDWRHPCHLQVHVADPDEWVNPNEVESLMFHARQGDLFRYADQGHMFVDPSSRDYDADAADLFEDRVTEWLDRVDSEANEAWARF
ncbi:dienelactone hydrolase family protein [Demequina aurantiaca]|uniref:dienelactone hydrolase family protein n=1 Tax=Demequina aurantiaca TaxID=676200 RepID=UPI003D33AA33